MGLFILNKINNIVHAESHSLYRIDEFIIVHGNWTTNGKIRKMFFKYIHDLDFDITVDMNKKLYNIWT